jgi:membrane peptidoglycan carboxypeptidase
MYFKSRIITVKLAFSLNTPTAKLHSHVGQPTATESAYRTKVDLA